MDTRTYACLSCHMCALLHHHAKCNKLDSQLIFFLHSLQRPGVVQLFIVLSLSIECCTRSPYPDNRTATASYIVHCTIHLTRTYVLSQNETILISDETEAVTLLIPPPSFGSHAWSTHTQSDHAASALRCSHLLSSSQCQYPLG